MLPHDQDLSRARTRRDQTLSIAYGRSMTLRNALSQRAGRLVLPLAFAAALGGCATTNTPAAPPVPQGIDLNGRWVISNGAQSCGATFANADATSGTVRPEGGCPANYFRARQWTYEGGNVIVRDPQAQPLGTFQPQGPNQLSGQGAQGEPLTITR
jgi:hypothetical protein